MTGASPEIVKALELGIAYDDLLRKYAGPLEVIYSGEVAEMDAAYDAWIAATRAALTKIQGVSA